MTSLNVIVTGGSNGIGQSCVESFSKAGHNVLFTYCSSNKKAQLLTSMHKNTTCAYLDQGDYNSVRKFASFANKWAGERGVDVLVNNAALGSATVKLYIQAQKTKLGAYYSKAASSASSIVTTECSEDEVVLSDEESDDLEAREEAEKDEALFRVNALGPLWVTRAIMPLMSRGVEMKNTNPSSGRKVVIFVGSVGGGSSAVFPEYDAADLMSKSAVSYLSKHLAAEHTQDMVDVVCINPGATNTEMFRKSTLDVLKDPEALVSQMPKKRLIETEEVAEAISFLPLNPMARIFHGSNIDASMGLAVRPGLQTESRRF